MAVVVARAGVARDDGAFAHLEDAVEATEVGRVMCRHHDGESVALLEEEAVDDFAARLVEGRVGLVKE
jgi:hypothetical protein